MNILQQLRPGKLPETVQRKDTLSVYREIILQYVFNILLGIYTVFFALILMFWPEVIRPQLRIFYIIAYAGLFVLTAGRKVNYRFRACVVILFLYATGTFALVSNGLVSVGWLFLFAGVVLSNLLLGPRIGGASIVLAIITITIVGAAMVGNALPLPLQQAMNNPGSPTAWIVSGFVFLFTVSIVMVSVFKIINNMDSALQSSEKLAGELEEERTHLEMRVEERSVVLRDRVAQFEVASQIARQISGEMNLDNLLNTAVNLIRDRFGFYHVGIFLNDDRNEFSVLRAATGEAGRQMLERNHRLKIGEIGLVGFTSGRGEARIAFNVTGDTVHFKNPLLPETRSEMALPLRVGDKTIGALDVQSVIESAFSQDDIKILQTIADQLAVAFQKTQLVEQLQRTVQELESSYQATTQKAWRTHLRNKRQKLAYRYSGTRLDHQVTETDHAQRARSQGISILTTLRTDEEGRPVSVLAIPIKLRSQVLGVVDIHFTGANVSPDLISLIEGTVSRLAVSLENARLMEEIQYRAERERLVSEISSKVRAASDVDAVLRVAIQEIGKSLGVSEVMVQLRK